MTGPTTLVPSAAAAASFAAPQPALPTPRRGRAPIALLTWMLARPSADSSATIVLPAIAFAVTTALMLIVGGGAATFWSWTTDIAGLYQMLSVLALALLIVPLAALGGAAARLSARRRDDRLATLRLLGATPGTVTAMTILESTAVAIVGALAGVVLYVASMPLVGLIPFGGAPIGATAIWVGMPAVAGVVAGVAVIAAISAAVGLRAVNISPLGVRVRQNAPRMHWLRIVIGIAVLLGAFAGVSMLSSSGSWLAIMAILAGAFGAGVGILNLIGPWAVGVMAKVQLRSAKTPQKMLAARGILESPKAAWRQVSGVAMTSFVAVVGGTGVSFADLAGASADGPELVLMRDIRTGILITLIASFIMVACSVGVNQASEILDRRDLWVSLDRLGMPRKVMEATRTRQVLVPLTFVTVTSAVIAGVLVFPLVGAAVIFAPVSVLVIVGCFAAGFALVVAALLATRSVLWRVLQRPERA